MIDIDSFKKLNDNYGHSFGDEILKKVSKLVEKKVRANDIFARYGGDEFMIITPNTDLKSAYGLAERLRLLIEQKDFSHKENLTCSFGVGTYEKGDDVDALINKTDDALYQAKTRGRNVCCLFSEEEDTDEGS